CGARRRQRRSRGRSRPVVGDASGRLQDGSGRNGARRPGAALPRTGAAPLPRSRRAAGWPGAHGALRRGRRPVPAARTMGRGPSAPRRQPGPGDGRGRRRRLGGVMLAGRSVAEIGGGHNLGYAGRLLRLAGARVVKEEPAGGDPVRESARSWDFLAEGKQLGSTSGRKRAGRGPGPRPISEDVRSDAALLAHGSPAPPGLPVVEVPAERDATLDWAASGAMALTGQPEGAPVCGPGWQAAYVTGAAAAAALVARLLPWWSGEDPLPPAEAAASLGWRAAAQGLTRHGRTSCGGSTRLIEVGGVDVAAGLPRPEDVALLEAWSRQPVSGDPWCTVA